MDIACSSRYRHNTAAEVLCTVKVILYFRYYFTHHQFCKYMYMSTVSIEQSVIEKYNQVFGSSNRNLSTTLFQEKQVKGRQIKQNLGLYLYMQMSCCQKANHLSQGLSSSMNTESKWMIVHGRFFFLAREGGGRPFYLFKFLVCST